MILAIFFIFLSLINTQIDRDVDAAKYNLNIVRPYIDDDSYAIMVSNFYQIKNEDDFNKINAQINLIADEHNLSLMEVPN